VMNSFGKRNFMEPMGRPKHALKVPCFFFLLSLDWAGGGKMILFHFSLVPNVFSLCFLEVLNGFT
jgi:hypothetical protein